MLPNFLQGIVLTQVLELQTGGNAAQFSPREFSQAILSDYEKNQGEMLPNSLQGVFLTQVLGLQTGGNAAQFSPRDFSQAIFRL